MTCLDVERGKPDPQIFLTTAQQLDLAVDDCVVFEDARSGVTAAKRGGFVCIGVDRHGHPDFFEEADALVSDLGELNFVEICAIHAQNAGQ